MTAMIDTRGAPPMAAQTSSGISPDDIYSLYVQRKNKNIKILTVGKQVQQIYDGEWDTVLPELNSRERVQVANLFQQGIDGHGQRIASVAPTMQFPPERNSAAARERAAERRQVVEAWHYMNKMNLKRRRRARHLIALTTSPVWVRPGDGIPEWEVWDPLNTFPAPGAPDEYVPSDVIYSFKRSYRWLLNTYPHLRGVLQHKGELDNMVDCLLYCDANEFTMIAVAQEDGDRMTTVLLQRVPNLAGRPTVVVPGRITLGRLQGQFDQMIGMYEAQGLLWAMHLQALKRSIFAETWVVGRPNEQPSVVTPADPMRGEVGIVEGGVLETYRADPSVQTGQTLDRIERNERLTGGVPAELGGEAASNIRTARRGQQVLSSAIDFDVQEHQDILAASQEEENKAAIAIAKAYWGDTEKTLLVPFGDGQVTYTPKATFPTDTHRVAYAFSGVSADGLVIEGLQRVGAGVLSQQGFMEIDPLIDDPAYEHQRIVAEQIEKAHLAAIQQQAADPNGPWTPEDLALLTELVVDKKMPLYQAQRKVQEAAQARQQAAVEGQLSPQQMQPGMNIAGAPGTPQAAIPPQAAPTPDQQGLAALMGSLRNVQRGAPPVSPQAA